jgi:Zn-dependent peptidase ImmA (M78 family)
LKAKPPRFQLKIKLGDDPEKIGIGARELLGVTMDEQASWTDSGLALRSWREAFQTIGVLVFQVPSISMNEMRGFSVALSPLPIIAYNSSDVTRGRIFTIMHEFAHILLGESVLDSAKAGSHLYSGNIKVEQFCNSVAAAILIPKGEGKKPRQV